MSLRRITLALALLLPWARAALPFQDSPPPEAPPAVFQVSSELVQLDAVVTDKQGRHVRHLTADDFEIVEDGKVRPIVHVRYVLAEPEAGLPAAPAAPAPPASTRATAPGPETKRVLAIVIDDLSLSFEGEVWARTALRRLVDERIGEEDLVAIVRTGGGIGNLQQFTNDKSLLAAAIDGVRFSPAVRRGEPLAEGPETSSTQLDAYVRQMELARRVNLTLGGLAAIEGVVRGLERMPGRKSLLLVSGGLSLADEWGDRGRVRDRLRAVIDAAHRAAAVIYTMDPAGLRTFGGRFGGGTAQAALHEGLIDLAEETGGLALLGSNDLDDSVARVFEDQGGYYLIGYQPDETRFLDGKGGERFHRIRIAVRRKGLRVRSRRGFYARKETDGAAPRGGGFVETLLSPFPAADVPVRLTPLFSHDAARGPLVRCLLHVDAGPLTLAAEPDGSVKADLDAGVVSIGANGRPAQINARAYSVRLTPEGAAAARRGGLLLTLDLPVKPGPHQIRAAVRDRSSGRAGSAYQFLAAPDLGQGRLEVSGIVLSGAEDGTTPADPERTPAVRRFPPGASVEYAFALYNARRDRRSGEPRLAVRLGLLRDGTLLDDHPAPRFTVSAPSADAPVAVGGTFQLGPRIEAGEYTLQAVVLDEVRGARGGVAVQWIDFSVRVPPRVSP